MRRWTILALPLALGACVSGISGPDEPILRGHYSQGFEVDAFQPCGREESWWVTDGESLRSRYRALNPSQYQRVYAVVRGRTGPEGKYGHLGSYTRELSVSEVISIRAEGAGDCD